MSGSKPLGERAQGKRLLKALRPDDVVIASKLDRIFRSALDALQTVEDFKGRGVSLHLLDLGGDGPDGEVELPLRLDSSLALGVAGLPRGLPDLPAPDLPEWARLRRASA